MGGVSDSSHLSGDAVDFVPRGTKSLDELASELRYRFPNAKILREKDHVHVSQRGWNLPYFGRLGTKGL